MSQRCHGPLKRADGRDARRLPTGGSRSERIDDARPKGIASPVALYRVSRSRSTVAR